jgi:hypothetical protein
MGDPASAAQTFSKVLSRDPGNMEIRLAAADAFMAAGMAKKRCSRSTTVRRARSDRNGLLEFVRAPRARGTLGNGARGRGKKPRRGIELAPRTAAAWPNCSCASARKRPPSKPARSRGSFPNPAQALRTSPGNRRKPSAALFAPTIENAMKWWAFRLFAEGFAEKGAPLDAFASAVEAVRRLHHPGIMDCATLAANPGDFYGTSSLWPGSISKCGLERTPGTAGHT